MALDAETIAHLATLARDYSSSCLCVTAENGELRGKLNEMKGKTLGIVSFANQL